MKTENPLTNVYDLFDLKIRQYAAFFHFIKVNNFLIMRILSK